MERHMTSKPTTQVLGTIEKNLMQMGKSRNQIGRQFKSRSNENFLYNIPVPYTLQNVLRGT
jgi:hypothetical protein